MKIIEILKYILFALIGLSILAIIFEIEILSNLLVIVLPLVILMWYFKKSTHMNNRVVFIFLFLFLGRAAGMFVEQNGLFVHLISFIIAYSMLFYFSYQNNKSFDYSSRDIFTIAIGASSCTIIFVIALYELYGVMGVLTIPVILMTILLDVLLITAGMHYINIRSEQSMWFFLAILSFFVSDISLLLDTFYISVKELQVLKTIYHPLALFFLIKYINSDATILKSKSLQNF